MDVQRSPRALADLLGRVGTLPLPPGRMQKSSPLEFPIPIRTGKEYAPMESAG